MPDGLNLTRISRCQHLKTRWSLFQFPAVIFEQGGFLPQTIEEGIRLENTHRQEAPFLEIIRSRIWTSTVFLVVQPPHGADGGSVGYGN